MTYEVWRSYWVDGSPRNFKLATFQYRIDAISYADARMAEHGPESRRHEYRVYEAYTHTTIIHTGGQE